MEFGGYLLNVAKNPRAQERAPRKGSYPTKKQQEFSTTPKCLFVAARYGCQAHKQDGHAYELSMAQHELKQLIRLQSQCDNQQLEVSSESQT